MKDAAVICHKRPGEAAIAERIWMLTSRSARSHLHAFEELNGNGAGNQ